MINYLKIDWPESQKFMEHPEATLLEDSSVLIPRKEYYLFIEKKDPLYDSVIEICGIATYFSDEGFFEPEDLARLKELTGNFNKLWEQS